MAPGSRNLLLSSARWVNPRRTDILAANKPTQLQLAQQAGFAIPRTVITNDPSVILKFIDSAATPCVYKPLTWYSEPPNRVIFTSIISSEDVIRCRERVRYAPCVIQMLVPKQYEIRATIVDRTVFAVRIDSQRSELTAIDWRRDQDGLQYDGCSLPEEVEARLLKLHCRMGLVFGAYDLILTPSGEYVFLEVNPGGQWLWLELRTGAPISSQLAKTLCSR